VTPAPPNHLRPDAHWQVEPDADRQA
jgi:hypothetical protein